MAVAGCSSHGVAAIAGSDAAAASPILVSATTGPIVLDGELQESDWHDRATPTAFVSDSGEQARPYSEIRFLHDDATLYIGLYAADEDIEETDFFQLTLGTLDLRVYPNGKISASADGLRAASDVDGTVDQPGDFDEEWRLELAVPRTLMMLGAAPLPVHASRCDVTLDHVLRCGSIDLTVAFAPS